MLDEISRAGSYDEYLEEREKDYSKSKVFEGFRKSSKYDRKDAAKVMKMLRQFQGSTVQIVPSRGWAMILLFFQTDIAGLVILLNAVLLFLVNDRVMADSGLVTPVAYVVLATANPAALWYTPLHAASLLMALSIVFLLGFCALRQSMGRLAGCWAALGSAGLIFPPLLWLAPLYAVLTVGKAEDKLKFWTASLLTLCLPAAIALAFNSLGGTRTATAFFSDIWAQMSTLLHRPLHLSAAMLCRIVLTALAALLAIIRALGRIDRYKISRSAAVIRIIFLTLAICVLTALFCRDGQAAAGLVTYLPVALILNEYFGSSDQQHTAGARTLAIILMLVLLVERITCFV